MWTKCYNAVVQRTNRSWYRQPCCDSIKDGWGGRAGTRRGGECVVSALKQVGQGRADLIWSRRPCCDSTKDWK